MERSNPAIIKDAPFPNCYAKELLCIAKGVGVWLEDTGGKRYLDFAGGIAVNALGYGREDLAQRVYRQMQKLTHISNLFITEPALELSGKMVKSGDFQAVQFLNSGSEANETALKYARLYALRKKGPGHHKLLCFTGSFHGRTMGALSVTPTAKYQDPFQPLIPGVVVAGFNDTADLTKKLDGSFAGVIVEVVQGEGGLEVMTTEFAGALNRACSELDLLLIADEVQTGLSRTGSFYAAEGVGLRPDIVTLAKPLGGGLPLSAVLLPAKVNELIHPGEHGTTFGGGPVTTSLGSMIWDTLSEPSFIEEVRQKAVFLTEALEGLRGSFPFLGRIKGKGLLLGLEVGGVQDKDVKDSEIQDKDPETPDLLTRSLEDMREAGLLALRCGTNVLRIAPPLIITKEEIQIGIDIMRKVFEGLGG